MNLMLHSEGLCPGTEGVLGTVLPWLLYPLLCIDLSGEVELSEGLGFSRVLLCDLLDQKGARQISSHHHALTVEMKYLTACVSMFDTVCPYYVAVF